MPKLLNEKRPFKRLLHSEEEKKQLESKGFEAVVSSNVSAIAKDKADLVIRFHGGATYSYRNKGNQFENMMAAASKGKWVWRFLIRPNVSFQKVGSIVIKDDVPSRDMMEEPPKPKFKVEAIIPSEFDIMTKGMLPSIRITPIKQSISILGSFNAGGATSILSTMAGIEGITALSTLAGLV